MNKQKNKNQKAQVIAIEKNEKIAVKAEEKKNSDAAKKSVAKKEKVAAKESKALKISDENQKLDKAEAQKSKFIEMSDRSQYRICKDNKTEVEIESLSTSDKQTIKRKEWDSLVESNVIKFISEPRDHNNAKKLKMADGSHHYYVGESKDKKGAEFLDFKCVKTGSLSSVKKSDLEVMLESRENQTAWL